MIVKHVIDGFDVAEQLGPDDVDKLSAEGYKSIICNRPDGEVAGQTPFMEIQVGAEDEGMKFRNIPVVSGQLTPGDIAAFSAALQEMPRPIVAYCRTGSRSIQLWALAEGMGGMSAEDIMAAGQRAGYDLSGVVTWLSQNT